MTPRAAQTDSLHRTSRLAMVVLTIVAMLSVLAASASPAHFHAKPPSTGCDLCFTAHLSAAEAKPCSTGLAAPESREGTCTLAAISAYRYLRSASSLTRGPPPAR